jgi:hypothetical protein
MSLFNRQSLFVLPMLSMLAIPPSMVLAQEASRQPAVQETVAAEKEHKLFSAQAKKYKGDLLQADRESKQALKFYSEDKEIQKYTYFKPVMEKYLENLAETSAEIKKLSVSDEKVRQQKTKRLVLDLLHAKDAISQIKIEGGLTAEQEKEALLMIGEAKNEVEALLAFTPEKLPVSEEGEAEVVADSPEASKESKEDKAVAKEENKESSSVGDKHVCEEKSSVLPDQFNQLLMSQNMIMTAMMNLQQTMMQMLQQQQQNAYLPYMQNSMVPYNFSYPYHAQTPSGNWVYYPSGFQAGNQAPFQQPLPSAGGVYPEQLLGQGQGQPTPSQQVQPAPQTQVRSGMAPDGTGGGSMIPYSGPGMAPGQFGMEAFGFNLGS